MTRNQRLEKLYNIDGYPEHLREIVKVILEQGENLTDGIQYYAYYETILEFAEKIYEVFYPQEVLK